jgi:hypothetical protein
VGSAGVQKDDEEMEVTPRPRYFSFFFFFPVL